MQYITQYIAHVQNTHTAPSLQPPYPSSSVAPSSASEPDSLSQEVVENDLQTDPENPLPQPHLNTPIITLSPPQ